MTITLRPIYWAGDSDDVVRGWSRKSKKQAGAELFRVLYLTRRMDEIVVLHAFEKKTRRTTKADIELGKQRLKGLK